METAVRFPKQLFKELDNKKETAVKLPTDIPLDPDKFYQDFGLLEHPLTKLPVQHLTAYQYAVWKDGQRHRYREVIKSQKVGITTSSLIEDFQKAITPDLSTMVTNLILSSKFIMEL